MSKTIAFHSAGKTFHGAMMDGILTIRGLYMSLAGLAARRRSSAHSLPLPRKVLAIRSGGLRFSLNES
jgi:hypothetical protein